MSLNYSLAPEAPYPRALDECFHAVCWVMANRERLGARPDAKVVICGDSAGGNLSLGVCLRAAALGLKPGVSRPSGALIAYAPAMLAYVPSPSRMLSICDPLLPIGVLSRCIIGEFSLTCKNCLVLMYFLKSLSHLEMHVIYLFLVAMGFIDAGLLTQRP